MRDSVLEAIILYGALGPATNMTQRYTPQRSIWSKALTIELICTSWLPVQKLRSLMIKTDFNCNLTITMVNLTQHIQLLITSLKSEIVSSLCNDHSAVQVDILSWIHQRKVVKVNMVFWDPLEDPLYL